MKTSLVQKISLNNQSGNNIQFYIKREDLLYPYISGNKYRKLKYNLVEAKRQKQQQILTFGGAFSNHIAATAYAGKIHNFKTIGVIRGEELASKIKDNPTLLYAQKQGMQLHFVSRSDYRNKTSEDLTNYLKRYFGDFYLIPEGGTNMLAIKGCEEIIYSKDNHFDYICVPVGTGGTISGLINASQDEQYILGFPALKGTFLKKDICNFVNKKNWKLINDYHFGGYGKVTVELITFINDFKSKYNIPLDPLYTGKMMFGIFDLLAKDYFNPNSKLLIIHTGGLQGILGMNNKLKKKHLPLLDV